jgi:hypothetical protein
MISYVAAAVILGLCALIFTVTSPKRHKQVAPVEPAPEPRAPRDMSRAYPRPKGSRSKLNQVCPVCGTGQETGITGDLDGRLFGWPAHRTCAEWLGDWEPPKRNPMFEPRSPSARSVIVNGNLDGIASTGNGAVSIQVSGSPAAQVNVGDRNTQVIWSDSGTTDPVTLITNGMASVDEVRARLDRQIAANFTVTPAALEEHTHKVGDPLPTVRCACGAVFAGTPDYLRQAMEIHRQVGCRQP